MPEEQQVEQALARLATIPAAWVNVPVENPQPGQSPFRLALSVNGAAEILGVKPASVIQFRSASRAGRLPPGTPPFPAEDGRESGSPYWWPERAHEFLEWQAARPGRGAGGGAGKHRKRTGAAEQPKPKATRRGKDTRARYQVVADDLRKRIASGKLAPGAQLPSVVQLAEQHGVSTMTVQQALLLLKGERAIISQRGRGNFVAEKPE